MTYTIVLTNSGTGAQADNPGNELIDVLPAQLTLVSATRHQRRRGGDRRHQYGHLERRHPGRRHGDDHHHRHHQRRLPAGTVSNQGTISYDTDGNGTNDATAQTDDPAVAGAANPTAFVVGGGRRCHRSRPCRSSACW